MSTSSHPFLHSNNSEKYYRGNGNRRYDPSEVGNNDSNRRYFLELEDHEEQRESSGRLQPPKQAKLLNAEKDYFDYFEKFLEGFIFVVGLGLIIFIITVFYYDSLPVNRISSVVVFQSLLPAHLCHRIIQVAEQYAADHGGWTTSRHRNYPTTDLPMFYLNDLNITILDPHTQTPKSHSLVQWLNATIEKEVFPLISDSFQIPIEETTAHTVRQQMEDRLDPEAQADTIHKQVRKVVKRKAKQQQIYELFCKDLFIVKYDASHEFSQKHLAKHIDSSLISFNIALSPPVSGTNPTAEQEKIPEGADKDLEVIEKHFYTDGGTKFYLSDRIVVNPIGSLMIHNSLLYHEGIKITSGKRYLIVGFVKIRFKDHESLSSTTTSSTSGSNAKAVLLDLKPAKPSSSSGGLFSRIQTYFQDQRRYYQSIFFNRKFGSFSHCMEVVTYHPAADDSPPGPDPYFHLPHEIQRIDHYALESKTELECVNWFYPYFHAFYQTCHHLFFTSNTTGIKRYLQQGTIIFIGLAILVAMIGLCMMMYEYCVEYYGKFRKHKTK